MCRNDVISGILLPSVSLPLLIMCCLAKQPPPQGNFPNVAIDKPTLQVSTLDEYTSGKSVDGYSGTLTDQGDCAVTLPEGSPWWHVDLVDYYRIDHLVFVTNLSSNTDNHLLSFKIEVAMDTGPKVQLVQPYLCTQMEDVDLKGVNHYTCDEPLVGRVVRLTTVPRAVPYSLVLCEVEVFGSPLFKDTTPGSGTSSKKVYNQSNYDMKELRKRNRMDRHKLKATKRKKESATDSRASSAVVGTVAIIILSLTFGSIILSDCRTFYRCLKTIHRKAVKAKNAKKAKTEYDSTAVENVYRKDQPPFARSLSKLMNKDERCGEMEPADKTNACTVQTKHRNIGKGLFRKRNNTPKLTSGSQTWPTPIGMETSDLKNGKTKMREEKPYNKTASSLTRRRQSTLGLLRRARLSKTIDTYWTTNGRVFVKTSPTADKKLIKSKSHLLQMFPSLGTEDCVGSESP